MYLTLFTLHFMHAMQNVHVYDFITLNVLSIDAFSSCAVHIKYQKLKKIHKTSVLSIITFKYHVY